MKIGKYYTLNLPENTYWRKIGDLSENRGSELSLTYAMTDDNNIYYDAPQIIDYPEQFEIIDGQSNISLVEYLTNLGVYDNNYAIITRNSFLSKIQTFGVEYCNNFFSVWINNEVADFFKQFSDEQLKEQFEFKPIFLNWKLISFARDTKERLSGYELVFFIDSKNAEIRKKLNVLRFHALELSTSKNCSTLISRGCTILNNNISRFTYTPIDANQIKYSLTNSSTKLINNNITYELPLESIKMLANKVEENRLRIISYYEAFIWFITNIFKNNPTLNDLSRYDNLLVFGYRNEIIINRINQIRNGELNV